MTDSIRHESKNKASDQPLSVGKLGRDFLKSVLGWIVSAVVVSVLLSVLMITPQEWATRLGAWALFLKQWALVAIFVIFALFIVLFLFRLSREYNHLLSRAESPAGAEKFARLSYRFSSLGDTHSRIKEILQEFSETETLTEIKIIASTGGSIIPFFKEYVESGRPIGNTLVRMLLMDPSCPQIVGAAGHWSKEACYNIEASLPALNERFKKMGKKIQFKWKTYDFLPCVQGLLFGETYLFMGWMEWIQVGNKMELRGAEKPFSYFEKGDENAKYFFSLFRGWFDYAWNVQPNLRNEEIVP